MKLGEYFKRFFFVRKCVSCKSILSFEDGDRAFCPTCELKWNSAKADTCPECFKSALECTCMSKKLSKSGALCLRKLVFYDKKKQNEPHNRIIYFLKRNRNMRVADFIADQLSSAIKKEADVLGIEDMSGEAIITWVPRTRAARAEYGFDQSRLVCKSVERILNIPTEELVIRNRGGKEQKNLNREDRIKNARNRFSLAKNVASLENKVVFIFDDVVTTGASMAECVTLLRKSGAKAIICLAIAKS